MIIFKPSQLNSINKGVVILLGRGLVGSAIEKEILKKGYQTIQTHKFNWEYEDRLLELLKLAVEESISNNVEKIDFVWSAGKTGFNSDTKDTDKEYQLFKNLIELLVDLIVEKNKIDLSIHFMSSAGGLFEGERNITSENKIVPKSPYGELKYNQEKYLLTFKEKASLCIYRLSSLYGYIKKGQRVGLISALILNLIRQRTTHIYGNYGTLRDYLFVGDAAKFIVEKIKSSEAKQCDIFTLASGKPSTIFEIKKCIEKASMRRCYISFEDTFNDSHITFSPTSLPKNFMTTSIYCMIPRIYHAVLRNSGF